MHGHHRKVCEQHKVIVAQCRCPGPKSTQFVPCPGARCPGTKKDQV